MGLLERFERYVKVWTTSDEDCEQTPSTQRQFDLARMLAEELREMGVADAVCDEHCYVYGHIPATPGCEKAPRLGFIAHMDTADFNGRGVQPRVIENYDGKKLTYPNGLVLDPREFSHLRRLKGRTLIVTQGDTLLGADDKAGVAEIMELAQELTASDRPHGRICIGFCPDEETGRGTAKFDLEKFGADYAYTVDGGEEGEISWECFNAAAAHVEVMGKSIHPGEAKGRLRNASLIAMEINAMLPAAERPELTEGREGFFGLMHMEGSVERASLDYIVRDHDAGRFDEKLDTLRRIVKTINERCGEECASVTIREQYRNMREALAGHEHLVETAKKAAKRAGVRPVVRPVRGGTDGAALSFMGLPCPNLGTGGWCYHGPLEHITVEGMEKALEILRQLTALYAEG